MGDFAQDVNVVHSLMSQTENGRGGPHRPIALELPMRNHSSRAPGVLARAARVAFAFLVMNAAAVSGLVGYAFRRKVWR